MPKKRRERDRPKAALDAPYHPNERFLLSYESEEDEDVAAVNGTHSAFSVAMASPAGSTRSTTSMNHQADGPRSIDRLEQSHPVRQGEAVAGGSNESAHFDGEVKISQEVSPDLQDDSGQLHDSDEAEDECIESGFSDRRRPAAYEEVGMRPMFLPDMAKSNVFDDEDDYDSETDEAMAYLASVQHERQAIPALLTAHSYADVRLNGSSAGHQGAFANGVYISKPPDVPAEPAPEEEYVNAITAGFRQVRELLKQPATEDELTYAHETVFIEEVPFDNKEFLECVNFLRDTSPSMLQAKELSAETTWELLHLVILRFFLKGDREITQNIGWWMYMLLARLPDKLDMDQEQIEGLRELAKRAVYVRESVCKVPIEEASGRSPEKHTQTTVDTVLIIVGDFYNQRDLLELRVWPPI
ncbi:hypothetical protein AMS68_004485 [Peltaster fructicola]|uniref:Uncharacterized protein n=1 Tax=Peltaster fructicola TaxID=286661 RepID=A0A6H0XWJ3_9PEZI|nr:hypothetical protein AMS68_004485 [Peltaster fructicola]